MWNYRASYWKHAMKNWNILKTFPLLIIFYCPIFESGGSSSQAQTSGFCTHSSRCTVLYNPHALSLLSNAHQQWATTPLTCDRIMVRISRQMWDLAALKNTIQRDENTSHCRASCSAAALPDKCLNPIWLGGLGLKRSITVRPASNSGWPEGN